MIQGLRELLERIEPWKEIKSIIPGRIKPTRSHRSLSLVASSRTPTGVKCLAKSGSAVQEVFIVTSNPEVFERNLVRFLEKS